MKKFSDYVGKRKKKKDFDSRDIKDLFEDIKNNIKLKIFDISIATITGDDSTFSIMIGINKVLLHELGMYGMYRASVMIIQTSEQRKHHKFDDDSLLGLGMDLFDLYETLYDVSYRDAHGDLMKDMYNSGKSYGETLLEVVMFNKIWKKNVRNKKDKLVWEI